jgi:cytochrome c
MVGSTIAASPEYDYSNALKKLSGTWSEKNLDKFLKDPQSFAPGTKMQYQGMPDADDRRKVIQYLSTLK